ncbi:MAG: DNA repair protein RadA [Candidatus Magasanikbacteria bacterium RIFCSPHIGHO2_01_FULL_41_23]|uniref:DNA repair protein RadA n=1 Tax=Candidatus Magasanikbacteria bacterium RIFCSPLOWO2_01_FULL_40_15 TaxID=1798686 RepID=A0A1F6N2A0_9BACT|nr:MAG: DNA repair protein RadA [Candidatus Magasanikbacteria bacterium RIFCSPHIGHO2_01_FULL_41_23]OGH66920.1 MAG: DNA repair protein RadA [Candidatus Magasanikbacteria bacterium RIFCSPHIGHO2_02_FULL_41_35]OGH74899.1 MAG: DNA repair protein RadA [Candidatus Magasanikbacteria bacterium RIFCSPHIGHO2_12_FULL_41_16]OGH78126.1 MAG: DNA repair protein RadA [Candidatus Magasanikbacteria bacterium RIFCSPLOWO2_01_FULL_40_15]
MPKSTTIFLCSHCDAQYQKWIGRCLECGQWGTISESAVKKSETEKNKTAAAKTVSLDEIKGENTPRIATGLSELDRVLGGGIVPGSLILLGGEPGIGKSTLALQLATLISPTLYLSGEESVGQIKLRADRLFTKKINFRLGNETNVETICATITAEKPTLAVIDSIQTITSHDVLGEAGNPNQVRAATVKLLETAKSTNTAIVIIGHVTKEGTVAGPKTLEHLVDTVLYLEGERHHSYRLLRTVKNRFGATDEVGIFAMQEHGLVEVKNSSAAFIADRGEAVSGSILTCLMEGTRPMLVEIQALVNKTVFGYPVRKASGFDLNRLHVLVAVLEKRAGLSLGQYDIHINVVGGINAGEPAADLTVCLAIASSYKDKALGADLVVFGEVGLGGEVRRVSQAEKRIKESANLGMRRVITAASSTKNSTTVEINPNPKLSEGKNYDKSGLKIIGVKNIAELITHT